MFTHLVIVEDKGLERATFFVDPETRREVAECFTFPNDIEIEWDGPFNDMRNDATAAFFSSVKYTWCRTEQAAKNTATLIARAQPGRRVYIAQVGGAAFVPPGEVVFQTVNEKGVLPA